MMHKAHRTSLKMVAPSRGIGASRRTLKINSQYPSNDCGGNYQHNRRQCDQQSAE